MKDKYIDIFLCIILILIGLAVYQGVFKIPFIWDDLHLITSNEYLHDFGNVKNIFTHDLWHIESGSRIDLSPPANYYRPLINLSYFIDYGLWKQDPGFYHIPNLIFHLAATLLIFLISKRIFPSRIGAFLTAGIFLTHPMQTESVSWISGRTDVFAAAFILGALYYHLRMRETGNRKFLIVSSCLFLLGLFSKENAVLFPVLLIVYDKILEKRKFDLRYFREYIGYLFVIVFYFALRITLFAYMGTCEPLGDYSERIIISIVQLGLYLRMLVLPFWQHLDYIIDISTWTIVVSSITVLFILGLIIILIWRKRYKVVTLGLLWTLISLSIVLAINPLIKIMVYEHFLCLPIAGFSIALTGFLLHSLKKRYLLEVGLIIIFIFGVMTYRRNLLWQNPIAIWQDSYTVEPDSSKAAYSIAYHAQGEGDLSMAEYFYRKAVELEPRDVLAWLNMGFVYQTMGEYDKACRIYLKNIQLNDDNLSYVNLGICKYLMNDYEGALSAFEKVRTDSPGVRLLVDEFSGKAYFNLGNLEMAKSCLQNVLSQGPGDAESWKMMGVILFEEGNLVGAINCYSRALELDPFDIVTLNSLGYIYMKIGQIRDAEACFYKTLEIDPGNYYAHLYLSELYLMAGDIPRAQQIIEWCKKVNPNDPELIDIEKRIREIVGTTKPGENK